jgi:hypothetical protein
MKVNGFNKLSMPSVSETGVVVSVKIAEAITIKNNLSTKKALKITPSKYIFIIHHSTKSILPLWKNRFKTAVNISINITALTERKTLLKGTRDEAIAAITTIAHSASE